MTLTTQRTARIIVNRYCTRKCEGCCNNYHKIMANRTILSDITKQGIRDALNVYNVLCITGGEPLRTPKLTKNLLLNLQNRDKVFLYSSVFEKEDKDFFEYFKAINLERGISV